MLRLCQDATKIFLTMCTFQYDMALGGSHNYQLIWELDYLSGLQWPLAHMTQGIWSSCLPSAPVFYLFILSLLSVKAMPYVRHYIHGSPIDTLFLSVIVDLNILLHFSCQEAPAFRVGVCERTTPSNHDQLQAPWVLFLLGPPPLPTIVPYTTNQRPSAYSGCLCHHSAIIHRHCIETVQSLQLLAMLL